MWDEFPWRNLKKTGEQRKHDKKSDGFIKKDKNLREKNLKVACNSKIYPL